MGKKEKMYHTIRTQNKIKLISMISKFPLNIKKIDITRKNTKQKNPVVDEKFREIQYEYIAYTLFDTSNRI
jgi:hypothetical protein